MGVRGKKRGTEGKGPFKSIRKKIFDKGGQKRARNVNMYSQRAPCRTIEKTEREKGGCFPVEMSFGNAKKKKGKKETKMGWGESRKTEEPSWGGGHRDAVIKVRENHQIEMLGNKWGGERGGGFPGGRKKACAIKCSSLESWGRREK